MLQERITSAFKVTRLCRALEAGVRHHVFYVYLMLGFSIFGAGILLAPGLYKLVWIAGCVVVAVALPAILEKVLDPLNARRITKHLASTGATDIVVKPFPNHDGANFNRNGTQRYAKCIVKRGHVTVTEHESKASRT